MFFKYPAVFCVFLFFVDINAFSRRSVDSSTSPPATSPNVLRESSPFINTDSLNKNMDMFKHCIDQSLASLMGEVHENHLQPLFVAIGDHLNRFSKAFDDILAKPRTTPLSI